MNTQPTHSPPLSGRIDAQTTARAIGFPLAMIAVLINARLLKPLGNPAPNAPKWFAAAEVMELAADRAWLDKATRAASTFWRHKNERRSRRASALPASARAINNRK